MTAPKVRKGFAAPGCGVFDEDWGVTARGRKAAAPASGAQPAAEAARPAERPALTPLAAGLLLGCGAITGWGS